MSHSINPHVSFTVPLITQTVSTVPVPFQNQFQGLEVYLDAGVTSSYPGSGTTWFDISGNARHVSLTSTTFSADAGGTIVFSSGSQGAGVNMPWLTNSFTLSVWVRPTTIGSVIRRFVSMQAGSARGFANWAVSRLDGQAGVEQYHGYIENDTGVFTSARSNSQVKANQYQNFVTTYNGSTSEVAIYKNGSLLSTVSSGGFDRLGATTTDNTMRLSSGGEPLLGNMYIVALYNRAMPDSEITRLYNYFKARFGL